MLHSRQIRLLLLVSLAGLTLLILVKVLWLPPKAKPEKDTAVLQTFVPKKIS